MAQTPELRRALDAWVEECAKEMERSGAQIQKKDIMHSMGDATVTLQFTVPRSAVVGSDGDISEPYSWEEADVDCPECGEERTYTDGERLKCLNGC